MNKLYIELAESTSSVLNLQGEEANIEEMVDFYPVAAYRSPINSPILECPIDFDTSELDKIHLVWINHYNTVEDTLEKPVIVPTKTRREALELSTKIKNGEVNHMNYEQITFDSIEVFTVDLEN